MADMMLIGITLLVLVLTTIILQIFRRRRDLPVLLLNYSCQLPDSEQRCTVDLCEYIGFRMNIYNEEAKAFMRLIHSKSGVSEETCMPRYVMQPVERLSIKQPFAIQEAEEGLFSVVSALLHKTDVMPKDISLVLVACSLFAPAPSLSSLLVKRFGFNESVKTYNLSGMGCSAGTMCIDLAARLLRCQKGYAIHIFKP